MNGFSRLVRTCAQAVCGAAARQVVRVAESWLSNMKASREEPTRHDTLIWPLQLRCRCTVRRPYEIALRHGRPNAGTVYAGTTR